MNHDYRVGILWLGTPGYIVNSLGHLASKLSIVVLFYVDGNIPTDIMNQHESTLKSQRLVLIDVTNESALNIQKMIKNFDLNVIVVCGWHFRKYTKIAKTFSGIKILTLDNQWRGSLRQNLGIFYGKLFLKRRFNGVFVPGKRSRLFANKLGFADKNIEEGLYVANEFVFKQYPSQSVKKEGFIFTGRLVKEKNLDNLIKAYSCYRNMVENPLQLKIAGYGPLMKLIENCEGVEYLGNLSQTQLAKAMNNSRFMVLPSISERWGVVIHESCLVGTPVICTSECGASDLFVDDMESGILIHGADVKSICESLKLTHSLDEVAYKEMSLNAKSNGEYLSSKNWPDSLLKLICQSVQSECALHSNH